MHWNITNDLNQLTAAAKSNWPPAAGLTTAGRGGIAGPDPAFGLGAVGIGGLLGGLGTPGFAAIGGAEGFGLDAIGGGGLLAKELDGLELAGESSEADGAFFHGVADPLEGPIPGKTEIGLADASAAKDLTDDCGVEAGVGVCLTASIEGAG